MFEKIELRSKTVDEYFNTEEKNLLKGNNIILMFEI